MRLRYLIIALLFALPTSAQTAIGTSTKIGTSTTISSGSSGMGTVALLNNTALTCTNALTCTTTIPATTGGKSFLVIKAAATGAGGGVFISGTTLPTAGVCSVSWQVPTAVQGSQGAGQALSDAFCPTDVAGQTSVTFTWTSATPGSGIAGRIMEFSYTGAAPTVDSSSTVLIQNTAPGTTLPGVGPLTLAGPNSLIVQAVTPEGGTPSAITTYTNFNGAAVIGTATLLNTTSGAAPNWTNSSSQPYVANAIVLH